MSHFTISTLLSEEYGLSIKALDLQAVIKGGTAAFLVV